MMHGCGRRCTKYELTEVLVFGDEHPVLFIGQCKQRFVPGSGRRLPRREGVVTQAGQQRVHAAGCRADVEEKFHEACRTGTRS